MRRLVRIAALLMVALPAVAQTAAWISDAKSGCRVWNIYPEAGETMSWSGACRDGMADGRGVVQYSHQGKSGGRYEGDYKRGMLQGRGVYLFPSGSRYEGEFRDSQFNGQGTMSRADGGRSYVGQWSGDRPNGQGTYTAPNGDIFTGAWTNGCFKQGNRTARLMAGAKDCGFD